MTPALLVIGVSASEAVADLWRLVSRGPVSYVRLLARVAREAFLRGVALITWVTVTSGLVVVLEPDQAAWTALWSSVALGLTPLLFAGVGVAPHVGPLLYLCLHGWTILRLGSRLQAGTGLSYLEGTLAVLAGAAGYWLCREVRIRPERKRRARLAAPVPGGL